MALHPPDVDANPFEFGRQATGSVYNELASFWLNGRKDLKMPCIPQACFQFFDSMGKLVLGFCNAHLHEMFAGVHHCLCKMVVNLATLNRDIASRCWYCLGRVG
jgi:hypothetical protein